MNKCAICYQLKLLKKDILFKSLRTIDAFMHFTPFFSSFIIIYILEKYMFLTFLYLHTLGILTKSQSKGIAVPDASMFAVKSTSDVLMLMGIGLKNRAMGATAMNERSSRSHR